MAPEAMKVSVAEQKAVAEKFAAENLSAFNAAQNGYVDGIVEESELRQTLIMALDMLSGKRVATLSKKHSTI
jgi:acetyl-CoA carboxylase carboxyltransferase component